MMMWNFPFHLVTISPWPILMSISLMNSMMGFIYLFYLNSYFFMFMNFFLNILVMYQWWRDIVRESLYQGFHTFIVYNFLKFSMVLFIISELFFFVSFFWTYFHSSISLGIELGYMWPPKSIEQFNPYDIPLLNSIILISSGLTVSWSHYSLLNSKFSMVNLSLIFTIILGFYFSMIQYMEYLDSSFCMNDSVYGSIFFISTGFHGLHVLVGTFMLLSTWIRLIKKHFSKIHHFNFESSLWYWHFVDVVWLFLYLFIYWWMY